MVKIIGYKERHREDGTSFYILELQGSIEMVKSITTGSFYATAKKAYITSTIDEQTCSDLIGTQMEGSIVKEKCKPFTYTVKETGEEITLEHKWMYKPKETIEEQANTKQEQNVVAKSNVFSENGILEPTM